MFVSHFGLSSALLIPDRAHRGRCWEGDLICVPRRQVWEFLRSFHDGATQGHSGTAKTLAFLARRFASPHVRQAVDSFVRSCPACQVSKAEHANPRGLLQSTILPLRRWQSIALDWTFLPSFRGFDCVLTVTDRATKMVHLIAAKSADTPQDTAKGFFHEVVRLHGLPRSIISDRDVRFLSRFRSSLYSSMDLPRSMSSGFYPQDNGQAERTNQTLKQALRTVTHGLAD